jgi:hypothetical protein
MQIRKCSVKKILHQTISLQSNNLITLVENKKKEQKQPYYLLHHHPKTSVEKPFTLDKKELKIAYCSLIK